MLAGMACADCPKSSKNPAMVQQWRFLFVWVSLPVMRVFVMFGSLPGRGCFRGPDGAPRLLPWEVKLGLFNSITRKGCISFDSCMSVQLPLFSLEEEVLPPSPDLVRSFVLSSELVYFPPRFRLLGSITLAMKRTPFFPTLDGFTFSLSQDSLYFFPFLPGGNPLVQSERLHVFCSPFYSQLHLRPFFPPEVEFLLRAEL